MLNWIFEIKRHFQNGENVVVGYQYDKAKNDS